MSRFLTRFAAVALLGLGLTALAVADDEKKKPDDKKPTEEKKSDKAPDWSAYATVGDPLHGEVVKADDSGFTLRISWLTAGKSTRPTHNLFRPANPKEKHTDYQLTFADESLVRWKTLPPKGTDDKGKPAQYTEKERTELRKPTSAPGYAAERGDLKPGQLVDVTLVRPKSVSADKATLQDLKVKYAVITGTDPKGAPAEKEKKKKGN
jgi:hypothetical protein